MTISQGQLVVANGLPGTVLGARTAAGVVAYQVALTQSQVRWLAGTQFTATGVPVAGDSVLVGSTPATVIAVWAGGPYPLYLVRVDQTLTVWLQESHLNPPLPPAPPSPPAGATAGRIPARV